LFPIVPYPVFFRFWLEGGERGEERDGEIIMEEGEMQQQPAGEISKARVKGIWGGIQKNYTLKGVCFY